MSAQSWTQRVLLERELDPVRAFALAHYLDAHGIPVTLAERPLGGAMGEIPFQEIPSEIFLEDASRLNDARELIRQFRLAPTGVRGALWRCARCGETHEPEFGACWNCGATRP